MRHFLTRYAGRTPNISALFWCRVTLGLQVLLAQCYNMTLSTAASLNAYLLYLYPFASGTYAHNIFARNGGIKLQQSAYKWLFDTVDPLVQRLSPSQSRVNFMKNFSWEDTRSAALVDTMYTGRGAYDPNVALSPRFAATRHACG